MHNIHLELMDEYVKICDKHNLKYYLYGGTLLGAVRHKGFIPWDDDVDIVMHRDDYEKFGELCKAELDTNRYFYQTCFTDDWYPKLFAKIRMNHTSVREMVWDDFKLHKGVYIDILPLYNFPKSRWHGKRLMKRFQWLNTICNTEHTGSLNPIRRFLFKLYKKMPREYNYKCRNRFLDKLKKYSDSNQVCSFGSHYRPYLRHVMKRSWFSGDQYMEFEGRQYRVPIGWDAYLLHLYGETYMTLPLEDKRQAEFNFYEVEFDTRAC